MTGDYIPESSYKVANLFRKILVPVDGSALCERAVSIAIDFAQRYGSYLQFIYIYSSPEGEEKGEEIYEKVKKKAEDVGVKFHFKKVKIDATSSSVATEIVKEARNGLYSAIILGAKGWTDDEETNIGSAALAVAVNAPCTVLVVR